jgi:tRNA(Ile)-lysidine synthase
LPDQVRLAPWFVDGLTRDDETPLVVAISGGSDSTALLHLILGELTRSGSAHRLHAATVDHGLRTESGEEAEAVAALCAGLGIRHAILPWQGVKPVNGVASAARNVRYQLLADHAQRIGARQVLLGHTADDQVETILMRRARNPATHTRGLSGMSRAVHAVGNIGGAWFLRLLLHCRRDALRQLLAAEGIGWIDDPGNDNAAHERVRVRHQVKAMNDPAFAAILAEAAVSARARIMASDAAAQIIDACRRTAPGLYELPRSSLINGSDTGQNLAVSALLATVGGQDWLAPELVIAPVLDRLIHGKVRWRESLGGTLIDVTATTIRLHREFRGTGPRAVEVCPGAIFDGRYRVASIGAGGVIRAAGLAATGSPGGLAKGAGRLLRGAAAGLPVVESDEPGATTLVPVVGPFARFAPAFDLALVNSLCRLVGTAVIAPPQSGGEFERQP